MTTAGFDAKASDEDKSLWAESNVPIDALARNLSPEDSKEADSALAIFKNSDKI